MGGSPSVTEQNSGRVTRDSELAKLAMGLRFRDVKNEPMKLFGRTSKLRNRD